MQLARLLAYKNSTVDYRSWIATVDLANQIQTIKHD